MSEPSLHGARSLRELLARHGARPTKALGQSFVIDPNTIRKVIKVSRLSAGDDVLEVGAGAGSLTLGLAAVARRVIAIEIDRRLVAALEEALEGIGNVSVVAADVMELDLGEMGGSKLVANLPYNLATHVVLRVLEGAPGISELTVMVQKEVGERLSAPPGSKTYGQTSVLVAYWAEARMVAGISRRAFWPVPAVDSVLVRVVRHAETPSVDNLMLKAVVKAAFGQRRKTLRRALTPLVPSAARAEALCERAGVDSSARAEQIGLEGFVALARELA